MSTSRKCMNAFSHTGTTYKRRMLFSCLTIEANHDPNLLYRDSRFAIMFKKVIVDHHWMLLPSISSSSSFFFGVWLYVSFLRYEANGPALLQAVGIKFGWLFFILKTARKEKRSGFPPANKSTFNRIYHPDQHLCEGVGVVLHHHVHRPRRHHTSW